MYISITVATNKINQPADSLTVTVFAFGAGGSRFNPQPGHTKDIKMVINPLCQALGKRDGIIKLVVV